MRTVVIISTLLTIAAAGNINRLKGKRGLPYSYGDEYGSSEALTAEQTGSGNSPPSSTSHLTLNSVSDEDTESVSGLTLSSAPASDGDNAIVEVPAPNLAAVVTASYQAEEGPDYGSGKLPLGQSDISEGFGAGTNSAASTQGEVENISAFQSLSVGGNNENIGTGQLSSNYGRSGQIGEPFLISIHQEVVRRYGVPISQPFPVPTPINVYFRIEKPVPFKVDKPYAVPVNVPYPVPVDRPYSVLVDRTYPYPVPHPVFVAVPRPYPVPVAQPIPVPVLRQ